MPDSDFWDRVKAESEQPPKRTYTQADLVRSLADERRPRARRRENQAAVHRPEKEDELLHKMRQVYREAREIGRQFETRPVPPKKQEPPAEDGRLDLIGHLAERYRRHREASRASNRLTPTRGRTRPKHVPIIRGGVCLTRERR